MLVFIAHDCPIANGYAPEIQRIAAHYGPQKIAFYLVYVEPDLSVAGAKAARRGLSATISRPCATPGTSW